EIEVYILLLNPRSVYLDNRNPITRDIEMGIIVDKKIYEAISTDGNTLKIQKIQPHHPMKLTQYPRLISRLCVKVNISNMRIATAKRYDIRMPTKVCKILLIVYPKLN
ncbi:MAG: hypothetical protein QXZ16_01235, partial [Ignisphaera sp.]